MTIRAKLALGLMAVALVLLVPLVLARRALGDLHQRTKSMRSGEMRSLQLVAALNAQLAHLRDAEAEWNGFGAGENITQRRGVLRDSLRDVLVAGASAFADSARALGRPGSNTAPIADSIRAAMHEIVEYIPGEYRALADSNTARADTISDRFLRPSLARADTLLDHAEFALRERMSTLVEETNAAQEAAAWRMQTALGIAVALALVIAVLIWRSFARPVRDLEAGMAAIADGNFSHRLRVKSTRRDEFGRLAASYQSMAEQLVQLDRLKAEFVSVASHELKTPINVIVGYVQLLQEGVYGAVTPKQRDILKTLEAQAFGLSRLVHQLLDVSRFEAGGAKLDLRPIALDKFLSELERTFRVLAIQRGIDFRLERNGDLPREVVWDPDRMNEVMGNLLSNAFKFTDRDGTVELRVESPDGEVHLEVCDTGAGIPEEQLPHVFEKFYQASNQSAAAHAGTGLGLAIAKQIVMAHNGTITVDSTVGIGTSFHLTMPVRAGSRLSGAHRVSQPGGAGVAA